MLAQVASVPTVPMTMSMVTESASARSSPPIATCCPAPNRTPSAAPQPNTMIADSTVSAVVQRRHPATRLAIEATTGARMGAISSTVISRAAPVAGPGRRRRRRGAADR